MSTREIAYGIVSRLNEDQLKDFIAAFGQYDDMNHTDNTDDAVEKKITDAEMEERMAAWNDLQKMIKKIPDFDYEKALDEYMEEKYGI